MENQRTNPDAKHAGGFEVPADNTAPVAPDKGFGTGGHRTPPSTSNAPSAGSGCAGGSNTGGNPGTGGSAEGNLGTGEAGGGAGGN